MIGISYSLRMRAGFSLLFLSETDTSPDDQNNEELMA